MEFLHGINDYFLSFKMPYEILVEAVDYTFENMVKTIKANG